MKRILLDSSALITDPKVLGLTFPDTKMIIPLPVAEELFSYTPSGIDFSPLVHRAQESGTVSIEGINSETLTEVQQPLFSLLTESLSGSDGQLISYAAHYKNAYPQDELVVATEDRDILRVAENLGIQTITVSELQRQLKQKGKIDAAIESQANTAKRKQIGRMLASAAIGSVLTLIANVIYTYLPQILSTFHVWGTILSLLSVGIAFYWFRSRYRLVYGITELGVGFVAGVRLVWPDFKFDNFDGLLLLQMLGGIYIMVRGLDNISHGLRGSRLGVHWAKWFPNK